MTEKNIQLSDNDLKELLVLGSGPELAYDRSKTVVNLIAEQAGKTPDAAAVVDENSQITYRELDELSNCVAHWLVEAKGVAANDFVAVMLPRVKEFVVAVLGIWKAGAAYVPIDLEYPEERKNFVLEDSCAKAVINAESYPSLGSMPSAYRESVNLSSPEGLAYMIYTSGSTGKPKGVMIEHRALVNLLHFIKDEWRLNAESRISCHSSFSFDASIEDLFPVLAAGGSVHILPEKSRRDLNLILDFLQAHRITGGNYTPSIGLLLAKSERFSPIYLCLGGERLDKIPSNNIRILNTYGPTEFTVDATWAELHYEDSSIPIGRPLPNCHVFICDESGHLLPRGFEGELCLAGPQIARGYWHQPKLTSERFVDCPYLQGAKMYRTGDLCRWNEDGLLEYIGRSDNQVKLRGFRIELGEIESVAQKQKGVSQAAAIVKNDQIVLYYTGEKIKDSQFDVFRSCLPEYMVPSAFEYLDSMPLTPNGKIDRNALLDVRRSSTSYEAPSGSLEQEIYDVVAEQFEVVDFGVTDNLISYGMSSIMAMRISANLAARGINIKATDILSHPCIRALAGMVEKSSETVGQSFFTMHELQAYYPLTENQRLVYLSWLHDKNTIQYNIPSFWYIPVEDVDNTRNALISVVNAHPHLKAHLVTRKGDIMQQRRDESKVKVVIINTDSEFTRDYVQSRICPFNLDGGDLYRIEIHRSSKDKKRACVILDIHHVVTDGLSMQIFQRDLRKALAGQIIDAEQYSAYDFAIDQQALVNSAEYEIAERWFDSLISGKDVTAYPHSYEGLGNPALASLSIEFEGSATDEYCRKNGFTQSNYFLTAFLYMLREVTREDDILISTINNGRQLSCMMDAIGMFVTTLPVSVAGKSSIWSDSVRDAVSMVQRQQFQTQNYDFYPFTKMVERHGIHTEIMYEFQSGITDADTFDIALDVAKLPLILSVDRGGKGGLYRFMARYDQSVYSCHDMERMLKMFSFIAESMPFAPNLNSIDLLDDVSKKEIMSLSAGPCLNLDINYTFTKAFRKCTAAHPDSLVVEDESSIHSYRELDIASDVLAHVLSDAGVEPDSFVALLLDRTWFFPLSVIAVHKAGSAYVPLDPEYPVERLQYMLDDCEARALLTTRKDFENKKKAGLDTNKKEVIFIEELDLSVKTEPIDLSNPSGNAMLIYTSGSTGKPKGAVLHQAGLWNFICSIRSIYNHSENDRIASHRSFSFVSHIEDIFVILTVGGSLHIMPSVIRKDISMIHEYLESHQITGCGFVASVTMLLLKHYDLNLRYITGGAEVFSGVVNSGNPQIIHSYGPTECTVHTSVFLLERGREYQRIPAGRPLPNNWIFVVSADGKLLPRGLPGELCFAGIQVAKGYWHNSELTSKKFCDCAFIDRDHWGRPVRMYHTGDMVRWNEDGYLEHIGRIDNQVKLRGFRIEPGEIESVALKCDGVLSAVAAVKNDTLVLYYTGNKDANFHWDSLPDYMIPSICMHLDSMPVNNNGKIDRKHMPEPEVVQSGYVAPETERERFLFDKVKDLIGTDNFGVTDNLSLLGLDSLKAMKLLVEIPEKWGIKISDIIGGKTIRGILCRERDVLWFRDEYNPSRKTVAVVHGLVGELELSELEVELSKTYNVLEVEHIYDTILSRKNIDNLVSEDGYNEFIQLYVQRIKEVIPDDGELSLFIGFSLGGCMAYDVACEWKNMTGQEPVVVMGDSYLKLSHEEEDSSVHNYSSEQWRYHIREIRVASEVAGEMDYEGELLSMMRKNKRTVQSYSGRVIMLNAVNCQLNDEVKSLLKGRVLFGVARWMYWHLHIRESVLIGKGVPKIGFIESKHRRENQENLSEWKKYKPDIEIINIDTNHLGLFRDKDLISRHVKLIEREVLHNKQIRIYQNW